MASKKDPMTRTFAITDPTKHEKGFTVYKVIYRIAAKNNPDGVSEFVIWKRYNDFKKLHKALRTLHYNLRRPEKFPEFARAKFFGRFDDEVIEERRESALMLLEFAANFQPIVNSKAFQLFFEGAEVVNPEQDKSLLPPPPLQPVPASQTTGVHQTPSIVTEDSSTRASSQASSVENIAESTEQDDVVGTNTLGGVWLHRQAQDDTISCSTDDDDHTTFTDEDSVPTTPLPQVQDLTLFDPFAPDQDPNETPTLAQSKSWLFEAMDVCAELEQQSQQSEHSNGDGDVDGDGDGDDVGITIKNAEPKDGQKDEIESPPHESELKSSTNGYTSTNLTQESLAEHNRLDKDKRPVSAAKIYLDSIKAQTKIRKKSHNLAESDSDSAFSKNSSPRKPRLGHVTGCDRDRSSSEHSVESVSNMDLGGKDDYLFQAAHQISLALENEANGNFDKAFTYYKVGVNILLKGVVVDNNKFRRDAVRRKTGQYLMKAEDIYNKYLSAEVANARRWEAECIPIELDPTTAHLRGSPEEMKNYKVLGIIDRVMLVLDVTSYSTFIIKILHKCSMPSRSRANRIPTTCPYMVHLNRYYETETAVYLVLEHATGGKLWVYAGAYFHDVEEKAPLANSLERSLGSKGSRRSRCNSSSSNKDARGMVDNATDSDVFDSPAKTSTHSDSSQGMVIDAVDNVELSEPLDAIPEQDLKMDEESESEKKVAYDMSDPDLIAPAEPVSSYLDLFEDYSHTVEEQKEKHTQDFDDIDDTPDPITDLMKASSQYDNELFDDTDPVMPHSPDQPVNDNTPAGHIDFSAVSDDIKDKQPSITLFSIDSMDSPNDLTSTTGSPRAFSFTSEQDSGIHTAIGDSPIITTVTEELPEEQELDMPTTQNEISDDKESDLQDDSSPIPVLNNEPSEEVVIADAIQTIKDIESNDNASDNGSIDLQHVCTSKNSYDDDHGARLRAGSDLLIDNLTYHDDDRLEGTESRTPLNDNVVTPPALLDDGVVLSQNDTSYTDSIQTFDNNTPTEPANSDLNIIVNPFNAKSGDTKSEVQAKSPSPVTTMVSVEEDSAGPKTSVNVVRDYPSPHSSGPSSPIHTMTSANLTPQSDLSPDSDADLTTRRSSSPRPMGIGEGMVQGLKELISKASSSNLQTLITGKPPKEPGNIGAASTTSNRTLKQSLDKSTKSDKSVNSTDTITDEIMKSDKSRKRTESGDSFRSRSLSSLFIHLDMAAKSASSVTLPESCVRMWAAEIVTSLSNLHRMGLLCRDLRPDNVLLGERGHIRLTFFSEWKWVEPSCDPAAIEYLYAAPEVCSIFNLTPACDWWSLGALLFEMLTGKALYVCHPSGINSHTQLNIPDHVSPEARSLLTQLLQYNVNERLGSGLSGVEEIKSHPFFFGIEWNKLKG
ncbi:ribosomal protein S6 kinase delta-1-like [Glandiceps talaboti]